MEKKNKFPDKQNKFPDKQNKFSDKQNKFSDKQNSITECKFHQLESVPETRVPFGTQYEEIHSCTKIYIDSLGNKQITDLCPYYKNRFSECTIVNK